MGRAGLEPATLGLKGLPNELRKAAVCGNYLQNGRFSFAAV